MCLHLYDGLSIHFHVSKNQTKQWMCRKYGMVPLQCKLSKVTLSSLIRREEIKFSGLFNTFLNYSVSVNI